MERVQKIISNRGYCSRRKAESLIEEGRVEVNDNIITLGDKASSEDTIKIDNKELKRQKKIYLIFNKPLRCVTSLKDPKHKTIMEYIDIKERVYPVGRLDFLTEGLLILTNDGDFANKVMHPSNEIDKTYLAGVDNITSEQIKKIESGIILEDGKTSPAHVRKINEKLLEITIHEGKNRIIRRMLKNLGIRISFLKRTRIGRLNLGDLEPGKYRTLKKEEIKLLFDKSRLNS